MIERKKVTMEELLRDPNPLDTNVAVATKHGITRDTLFRKLKQELNAADTITVVDRDKEGKERVKKKKVPLWGTRQTARKDAHKLLGHYPSEKADFTVGGVIPVNIYTGRPPVQEPEQEEDE